MYTYIIYHNNTNKHTNIAAPRAQFWGRARRLTLVQLAAVANEPNDNNNDDDIVINSSSNSQY